MSQKSKDSEKVSDKIKDQTFKTVKDIQAPESEQPKKRAGLPKWVIMIEVIVLAVSVYFIYAGNKAIDEKERAIKDSANRPICQKGFDYGLLLNSTIVVLGERLEVDMQLKTVNIPETLAKRALSAQTLYTNIWIKTNSAPRVIVTGDDKDSIGLSVAEILKGLLTDGIPRNMTFGEKEWTVTQNLRWRMNLFPETEILQVKEKTTIDSAIGIAKIQLEKETNKKVVLVTSEYHMPRAKAIFDCVLGKNQGIEVFASPCVVPDPEMKSRLSEKGLKFQDKGVGKTYSVLLNNLEKVTYEKTLLKEVLKDIAEYGLDLEIGECEGFLEEALNEMNGLNYMERVAKIRWPEQELTLN